MTTSPSRCGRLDEHPAHQWCGQRDLWQPTRTYTCTGHIITEMELTHFDAADDAAEERAIRERRET